VGGWSGVSIEASDHLLVIEAGQGFRSAECMAVEEVGFLCKADSLPCLA